MFHLLEKRIAEAFAARIESLYGVAGPAQTEQPKQPSFGEIAVPAAFQPVFDSVITAVRAGLAVTLHDVFLAAVFASALALVASLFLEDIPIRRTQRGATAKAEGVPAFGG